MQTSEIIQIGREIIYLAGYHKQYTKRHKEKIKQKLESYKSRLEGTTNKYSKKLLIFIDDLLRDIWDNRPLQIDSLFEDDFVGNYYFTKKQAQYYNALFPTAIYKKILAHNDKSNSIIEEQYHIFRENFSKLHPEVLSQNLLIFTLFQLESPKPQLKRLYIFSKNYKLSKQSKIYIRKMLQEYSLLLRQVKKYGIQTIHTQNIHHKYIRVEKWELDTFSFHLQDAAKENHRSGNLLFEYRELLKNL